MTPRKKSKAIEKIERYRRSAFFWRSSVKTTTQSNLDFQVRQYNVD